MTSGRNVERTFALMRLDGLLAGVMSTPGRLVGLAHRSAGRQLRLVRDRARARPGGIGVALEHGLAQRHRHLDRVVAGEAGVAEAGADRAGGRQQPIEVR